MSPAADAEAALARFTGTGRRFEVHELKGVTVVDDYGHHPTEVAATVAAIRERFPGARLLVLFQPHLYSRTRHLAAEFAAALAGADDIAVTDVYPARERPIPGVTGKLIVDALSDRGRLVAWTPTVEQGVAYLSARVRPGDVLLVSGAGDVDRAVGLLAGPGRPSAMANAFEPEQNVSLARLTTIGTGGPARWFARPRTLAELQQALRWARDSQVDAEVIGLGSNLLVHDEGFVGLVLRLEGELAAIDVTGSILTAGGGATNAVCLHRARDADLGGFEFASAIPGTVGGGVRMNAGAYGREWIDVLIDATVVDADRIRTLTPVELGLSYRHSSLRARRGRRPGQVRTGASAGRRGEGTSG